MMMRLRCAALGRSCARGRVAAAGAHRPYTKNAAKGKQKEQARTGRGGPMKENKCGACPASPSQ